VSARSIFWAQANRRAGFTARWIVKWNSITDRLIG
jgi:hypothetical protein